jgi:hypothetical protein
MEMIFTLSQWKAMLQEEFHIGAAPFGPDPMGKNWKRFLLANNVLICND